MSFEKNFCPSPWFSVRLRYDGSWQVCRWGSGPDNLIPATIFTHSLNEIMNHEKMRSVRQRLLSGDPLPMCKECAKQDTFQQLSGKTRQRLKIGVRNEDFENTFLSSSRVADFAHSAANSGSSNMAPVDLQIDLSNVCNNSCIMCDPSASTKVGTDFRKLHKISSKLFYYPEKILQNWANDKDVLDKFINNITNFPVRYIHFLGGETLFIDEFYIICDALIAAGVSKDIIIGTTTNGTIFNDKIKSYCNHFKEVHLGISVETATSLNDYVRYGSKLATVLEICEQFAEQRTHTPSLNLILRTTVSNLTVFHFNTLLDFSIKHNLASESCHILSAPACLQVEILPPELKKIAAQRIKESIKNLNSDELGNCSANVRLPGQEIAQIKRVGYEVISLLETSSSNLPEHESLRYELVTFLKAFEQIRNNSIIEYLPEYENFLRSYGY